MFLVKKVWQVLAAVCAITVANSSVAGDQVFDGASFEYGSGTKTRMVRVGLQKDWETRFFESNGTHVGTYWDLTFAHWRGNQYRNIPGATQHLNDIGLTPVLRFQKDSKQGLYGEFGIGWHLLSELYDNNDFKLSTHFQFGDHVGIGYVAGKWDLSAKVQHFSNGGYKKPNTGVNFIVLKAAYRF